MDQILSATGLRLLLEVIAIAGLAALVTYALIRPRLALHERTKAELLEQAERDKRAALVDAREEALRLREQLEDELRQKRQNLERLQEQLNVKDAHIESRRQKIEEREDSLQTTLDRLAQEERLISDAHARALAELERISGLDRTSAEKLYLEKLDHEMREQASRRAQEIREQTVAEAEKRARSIVLDVMERCSVEYVTEATVAVVTLPSEEMKGRIIGREGRNIRAFEQVTGVDLIVDETPEAVVISCFDPVRRETARLALMNLMVDGRIHPGRIEELYQQAQTEVSRMIAEAGERAAERAGIPGLHPRVIETMGRLRFRTSYAQNVLDHSVETANLAAMIAAELGCNVEVAKRAGFLHDIGKALDGEWEGPHAIAGMDFLRSFDLGQPVLHAVGAHHHDIEPETAEAKVVIVADSLSAARPGARRESLDSYVKRLTSLEKLAAAFPGVERAYALQAGRELRLMVKPEEVDDGKAAKLASEVARKIEQEMEYPGQIKITVIRESRASDTAR